MPPIFLFFLCLGALATDETMPVHSAAHVLTEANFAEKTKEGLWLLDFFAPWCGHCKHLAPVWEEAAAQTIGRINFGTIDCTVEKELASRYNVKGYPTLKFLKNGVDKPYTGSRTLEGLLQFVDRVTGPAVHSVTNNTIDVFAAPKPGPRFLFLGPVATPAFAAFEEVASSNQESLIFGQSTTQSVLDKFKIVSEKLPAVIVINDEETVPVFKGFFDRESLAKFVQDYRYDLVTVLDASNFGEITRQPSITVVAASSPTNVAANEKFVALVRKVAAAQRGRGKFLFCQFSGAEHEKYLSNFGLTPETLPAAFVLDPNQNRWALPGPLDGMELAAFNQWLDTMAERSAAASTIFGQIVEAFYSTKEFAVRSPLVAAGIAVAIGILLMLVLAVCQGEERPEKKDN